MADRKMIPVLAGGGTRLPAHVGILTALEQMDYEIPRLVGVSGGSIVAALYARGRHTAYLKRLAFEVDFRQFRGFSLKKLIFHGGLSSGPVGTSTDKTPSEGSPGTGKGTCSVVLRIP